MNSFGIISISNSDFDKIKNRKIGEGNDAIVYNAGNGMLYKVYKDESMHEYLNKPTKVYKGAKKDVHDKLLYLDKDGVKIYYKDAFKRIVKRREDIKLTSLPLSSLYIDGKFKGCVLKKINGVQLHNIFQILNKKTKLRILKEIIIKVKELTDNYIYPIDTANSPIIGKHSNILLNYKLKPELIDLDGKSTLYRETYDEKSYMYAIMSLNLLFLELLNDEALGYHSNSFELDHVKNVLIRKGINEELAYKLSRYKANYDELERYAELCLKIK